MSRLVALFVLCPVLCVAACSAPPPQLEDRITPASRAAAEPELIPLGPIFGSVDSLLPEDPEQIGRTLEARAAGLRRRAAALRALEI